MLTYRDFKPEDLIGPFPGTDKPVNNGCYLRRYPDGFYFSYFNGFYFCTGFKIAHGHGGPISNISVNQTLPWYGLRKAQNAT